MILPAVSAGTLDFGGSRFTDTEERRKNYDFVNTLNAGVRWAQSSDRTDTIDPDNACGLTVAVQRTTVSETDDVDRKSTRNSSHVSISYAVFCLKKKKDEDRRREPSS